VIQPSRRSRVQSKGFLRLGSGQARVRLPCAKKSSFEGSGPERRDWRKSHMASLDRVQGRLRGPPCPRRGCAAERGEAERGESAGHRLGLADQILFVSNEMKRGGSREAAKDAKEEPAANGPNVRTGHGGFFRREARAGKSPGSRAEAPRIPECKFRAGEPGAGSGTDDEKEPFDSAQDRPNAESQDPGRRNPICIQQNLVPLTYPDCVAFRPTIGICE
jgi:hypothetical protein